MRSSRETYSPERIPKVEEFVDEALKLNLRLIIDLKTWRSPHETADVVCGLFAARPKLYSRAIVSTFFPHLIYAIRARDPKIVAGMAWRPHFLTYENWDGHAVTTNHLLSRMKWPCTVPCYFFLDGQQQAPV